MGKKSRVFIGSSSECKPFLDALYVELERDFDLYPWDYNFFQPSSFALEDFEKKAKQFDFAIFILHPDDYTISRENIMATTRDNVIFEIGLFIGAIGRKNVLLLEPFLAPNNDLTIKTPQDTYISSYDVAMKLPTDVLGITTIKYDYSAGAKSMYGAAIRIKTYISSCCQSENPNILSLWPLKVAIVSRDDRYAEKLHSVLKTYDEKIIVSVIHSSIAGAKDAIVNQQVDGIFIDIFSFEESEGVDLIFYTRDRRKGIGFSIFGTYDQLYRFSGIDVVWKRTLEHFWRLPKDTADTSFLFAVEDILVLFFLYKLSGGNMGDNPGGMLRKVFVPDVIGTPSEWKNYLT